MFSFIEVQSDVRTVFTEESRQDGAHSVCIWSTALTAWMSSLAFFEWREIPRESISFPMYLGEGVEIGYWEVKGGLASRKLVLHRQTERDAVKDVHIDGKNLRKFADKI